MDFADPRYNFVAAVVNRHSVTTIKVVFRVNRVVPSPSI
jgi:hypothetical protein